MARKGLAPILIVIFTLFLGVKTSSAQTASLSFSPAQVIQGEPILIQVNEVTQISAVKKISFGGKKLGIFMYQNLPSALVGIDLYAKPGNYKITAELTDKSILKNSITVGKRKIIEQSLGIPEKLGGNTKASQDTLIASLVAEKNSLAGIRTNGKNLWTEKFMAPLSKIFITDPYGLSRKTGAYSIAHKGVDYRAPIGTEVMSANRGVVRITETLRDYGKTIFIDHGQGLMTYYLHLSKIKVKVGDVVERGQIIGLSGDSGYTQGAHLHFGVRINEIGIDPVKFLEIFQ